MHNTVLFFTINMYKFKMYFLMLLVLQSLCGKHNSYSNDSVMTTEHQVSTVLSRSHVFPLSKA